MEGKLLHHKLYHMHCIVAPKFSTPAILTSLLKLQKGQITSKYGIAAWVISTTNIYEILTNTVWYWD
jgi:hypothetical protein